MNEGEAERIAHNESLFREVNERIAETVRGFDAHRVRFVCECSDPNCAEQVNATLEEYERIREDGATFLVAPGHEDTRVESVVEDEEGHSVVKKRAPEVASIARSLNPRAEEA